VIDRYFSFLSFCEMQHLAAGIEPRTGRLEAVSNSRPLSVQKTEFMGFPYSLSMRTNLVEARCFC
jgi:hypothetical protein